MKKFHLSLLAALLLSAFAAGGQTPTDGIMMEKKQVCAALIYGHDSWDEYWEGALLRTNGNVGTVTTQSAQAMVAAGLFRNFNLIVGLPFIWTEATGGTLAGQRGIQDFGLWGKYRAFSHAIGKGKLNLFAVGGLSTPASSYNRDILPLGLGLGCRAASLRGMANYYLESGPYFTAQWGHSWRSDVTLEREFYYSNGPHYTDKVAMPNVIDYSFALGFINSHLKVEAAFAQMITQGGSDIRRQDAPLCSNRMIAGRASALVQYYLAKPKGLSLLVNGGQVLSGRNVGKTLSYGGGAAYQFGY